MDTGYVIYKGDRPLKFAADSELRYRTNLNVRISYFFFDFNEAVVAMGEICDLFEFDNNSDLSIREFKLVN